MSSANDRFRSQALGVVVLAAGALVRPAAGQALVVTADFPGGNIRVLTNAPGRVHLAPDMRDGAPWFHWQFEAGARGTGLVEFVLADPPAIGINGPAVSLDSGASWQWLGTNGVRYTQPGPDGTYTGRTEAFSYAFTSAPQQVRFAVGIPYARRDLDAFLAAWQANSNLGTSVLAATRSGRPVPLLTVGRPGPGKQAVLVTARHHACEAMASYVLEGFLAEALSESPAGRAFRERHVLYAVPMVDADGVEAGDPGKGRLPHDHNRDYGTRHRYPEVRAIQALMAEKRVTAVLDFHDPYLRGESHTLFYFDGLAVPGVASNVAALSEWMPEELPPALAYSPPVWLKKPAAPVAAGGLPLAVYAATQKGVRLAATLEVPYALPGGGLDAGSARAYGAGLLRAWVLAGGSDVKNRYNEFEAWRAELGKRLRAQGEPAEKELLRQAEDGTAPALYRAEARLQAGLFRLRQKRYAEAVSILGSVADDPSASARQREDALALAVAARCADPASSPGAVEESRAAFFRQPYPSAARRARVHAALAGYFEAANRLDRALDETRSLLEAVPAFEKGKTLNRMAGLYDKLKRPDLALRCRQEAVTLLRRQLDPVPSGVFGPLMAADLYEALGGIPSATEAEKAAAARIVLTHPLRIEECVKRVTRPKTSQ